MTMPDQGTVDVPAIAREGGFEDADYAWAYRLRVDGADRLTARQWADGVFEGSAAPMRLFLLAGWRLGMRLRLGPLRSPVHVLGWPVIHADRHRVVLQAGSPLIDARNVAVVSHDAVTWVTLVRYHHRVGRLIWSLARPIHQLTLPRFLRRTARGADRG